jgi:hypothetical protein
MHFKKIQLKPHLKKQWCIPASQNGEFVALMEDILEVYRQPYDPNIPMICMDEQPYQFLGEKREPVPMKPGKTAREDYEYTREGTCSIFMFTEPLAVGGMFTHLSAEPSEIGLYGFGSCLKCIIQKRPKCGLLWII